MIFGPRKWFSKNLPNSESYSIHDYQFQWKYISTFSLILLIAFSGASIPLLYLYGKNYAIFEKLSFDFYPSLVENLYQEKNWMWILYGMSMLSLVGFSIYFGLKFTKKILYPIHQIEKHLHQMMLGNWTHQIEFDETKEDFKSIKISYDYFQRSLKANTEMELNLLQKIVVDPNNRDSYLAWKNLVEAKAQRIGLNPEDFLKGSHFIQENKIELDFSNKKIKKVS